MPTGVYKHKSSQGFQRGHQIWLGKSLSEKHKKKISDSRIGENNPNWKGDKAGYLAKHMWAYKNLGKPDVCEHCGKSGLSGYSINWANKSGKYLRKVEDWLRLCVSCHRKYDLQKND